MPHLCKIGVASHTYNRCVPHLEAIQSQSSSLGGVKHGFRVTNSVLTTSRRLATYLAGSKKKEQVHVSPPELILGQQAGDPDGR